MDCVCRTAFTALRLPHCVCRTVFDGIRLLDCACQTEFARLRCRIVLLDASLLRRYVLAFNVNKTVCRLERPQEMSASSALQADVEGRAVDWTGSILAVHTGDTYKRFFVVGYTNPVYMLNLQEDHGAEHDCFQFFFCSPKKLPLNPHEDNVFTALKIQKRAHRSLLDTREISVTEFLHAKETYNIVDVTPSAGANDRTAVLYAMGVRT